MTKATNHPTGFVAFAMAMPQKEQLWLDRSFIFMIGIGILSCAGLMIFANPHEIAYAPNMVIDGASYFSSAKEMLRGDQWILSTETYHSAGMQVLTALLIRIFGETPLAIRFFNFCCYLLSIALIFIAGKRLSLSKSHCLLAAALLALSSLVRGYVATLQYEVVAMTLLLGAACFYWSHWSRKYFAFGFLIGLTCFFRLHLLTAGLPFLLALALRRNWGVLLKAVVGFLSITLPLYLTYAMHVRSWSGFQSFGEGHYRKWLCLGAEGWNFPYFNSDTAPICGASFIFGNPAEFLALLGKRFLYWIGILPDIWWIRSFTIIPETSNLAIVANAIWVFAGISLFIAGVNTARALKHADLLVCAAVPPFAFLPFLVAGASTRFLVPFLPFIVLLISAGVKIKTAPENPEA